ncbi:MAG: hypothetical protein KJ950_15585 [Proteobacteria bacterium]|nr:hypothetical protein [Pseudomonadota bacterium]MBU1686948.1 hypothetical protein [Pseudomonadota bacterium]
MRHTIQQILLSFIVLVVLSGCGSSLMTQVPTIPGPNTDEAMVTILWPSYFGGPTKISVWDGENFLGISTARTYIQYRTKPGRHLFLARAENWSYVEADLQPGKNYYLVSRPLLGVLKCRVSLCPVRQTDYKVDQINTLLKDLTPVQVIPEKAARYANTLIDQVKEAIKAYENGEDVRVLVLTPEDGI